MTPPRAPHGDQWHASDDDERWGNPSPNTLLFAIVESEYSGRYGVAVRLAGAQYLLTASEARQMASVLLDLADELEAP